MKRTLFIVFLLVLWVFSISFSCYAAEPENTQFGMAIPFGVNVPKWDLVFENVYAYLNGDNVVFNIKFKNGMIKYYSFFNPPGGDYIKITGIPGETENKEGLAGIAVPLEQIKKFGNITINIIDEYSNIGNIFIKPSNIDYASLPHAAVFKDSNLDSIVRGLIGRNQGLIYTGDLLNIRSLNAAGKNIKDMSGIKYLCNLDELFINNNKITDISEIGQLKYLKTLNAGSNTIENISCLEKLGELTDLNLSNNNIKSIDPIKDFKDLKTLFIKNNPIIDYSIAISLMQNLKEYDFINEAIKSKIDKKEFIDLNMLKTHEDAVVEYTVNRFGDLKKNDWFIKDVSYLVALGVINGSPDGTFKPNGIVTADIFIKMVVASLGYDLSNGKEYWATPYIEKAKELKLVADGEFSSYTRQITRKEMARIIIRALGEDYDNGLLDQLEKDFKDYNKFTNEYREYIIKAYAKGIITGYTDGSFRPDEPATKASAATMITRMLDNSQRIIPEKSR